jgi:hypothetical protein
MGGRFVAPNLLQGVNYLQWESIAIDFHSPALEKNGHGIDLKWELIANDSHPPASEESTQMNPCMSKLCTEGLEKRG